MSDPTPKPRLVIATYMKRMLSIKGTGAATSESSFYSPLENLLNEIGQSLNPKIVCNGQLRNQGHNHPDFGLYSEHQVDKFFKTSPGEKPKHGVIEVKPLSTNLDSLLAKKQIQNYLTGYGLVILTNYREFHLYRSNTVGCHELLESVSIANTETEFWDKARHSKKTANHIETKLYEFIRRTLNYSTSTSDPRSIAWFLASYAKETLAIMKDSQGGGERWVTTAEKISRIGARDTICRCNRRSLVLLYAHSNNILRNVFCLGFTWYEQRPNKV